MVELQQEQSNSGLRRCSSRKESNRASAEAIDQRAVQQKRSSLQVKVIATTASAEAASSCGSRSERDSGLSRSSSSEAIEQRGLQQTAIANRSSAENSRACVEAIDERLQRNLAERSNRTAASAAARRVRQSSSAPAEAIDQRLQQEHSSLSGSNLAAASAESGRAPAGAIEQELQQKLVERGNEMLAASE